MSGLRAQSVAITLGKIIGAALIAGAMSAPLQAAPTFTEYAIPTPTAGAAIITVGPDGNLWFTESQASKIGRINATTGSVTEFTLPAFTDVAGTTRSAEPTCIVAAPDG